MAESSLALRPLSGRRIAITRPLAQSEGLREALERLGARVTALPVIRIEPATDTAPLDAAVAGLAGYDWIIFTSANGVPAVTARLAAAGRDWSARGRARIAAIGPATADALARIGAAADVVPPEYVAEAIVEALGNVAGQRILLPRADIARQALADELRLRGAEVTEITAYRTVIEPLPPEVLRGPLVEDRVDVITCTSSSTVRGLVASIRAAGLEPAPALAGIALAAIGPITAATLREHGLVPAVVAREYTVSGLVDALTGYLTAPAS